jgi:hypothetical protein
VDRALSNTDPALRRCAYDRWRFDREGACVEIPGQADLVAAVGAEEP